MDDKVNAVASDTEVVYDQIDQLLEKKGHDELLANCSRIRDSSKEFAALAQEKPENRSYLSLLKIVNRLGHLVVANIGSTKKLTKLLDVSKVIAEMVAACEKLNRHTDSAVYPFNASANLIASSMVTLRSLRNEYVTLQGSFLGFYMQSKKIYKTGMLLMTMFSPNYSLKRRTKAMFSDKTFGRCIYEIGVNGTTDSVKKSINFSENNKTARVVARMVSRNKFITAKNVIVPRVTKHVITADNNIELQSDGSAVGKSIKCRLYKHKSEPNKNNWLVIQIHGGGYFGLHPSDHDVYVNKWTQNLGGVAILSIDYTLTPEGRFPVIPQECLDVYMWLTSGREEVKQLIGFNPSSVVLAGDSAGGHAVLTLTTILHAISKVDTIVMPAAVVAMYAITVGNNFLSPARYMSHVDCFVTHSLILAALDAYVGYDDKESTDDNYNAVAQGSKLSKEIPAWYHRDTQKFENIIEHFNKAKSWKRFFSPFNYEDLDEIKVPLFLLVGEFDPFLDDSTALASRWKGPVKLEVFDELTHGFCNLSARDEICGQATDICRQRLLDGFAMANGKGIGQ